MGGVGQGKWATSNGNLVLTTNTFSDAGSYKIKVNATSMTGVTLCSTASATATLVVMPGVLPLSLTRFTGRRQQTNNLLEWVTENEQDVSYFGIERSSNEVAFTKIGSVNASGSNSTKTSYSFTDKDPLNGINYYRLKMMDNDGRFTYSNVVALAAGQPGGIIVSNVSPNPFTDKIKFSITYDAPVSVNLQIVDFMGRICNSKDLALKKGNNVVEYTGLGNLTPGIYYLRINMPDHITQQKIVKIK